MLGLILRGKGPAEQVCSGMFVKAVETPTCTHSTPLTAGRNPPCGDVALLNRAGAGMSGNAAATHLYSTKLASASLTAGQQGLWQVLCCWPQLH